MFYDPSGFEPQSSPNRTLCNSLCACLDEYLLQIFHLLSDNLPRGSSSSHLTFVLSTKMLASSSRICQRRIEINVQQFHENIAFRRTNIYQRANLWHAASSAKQENDSVCGRRRQCDVTLFILVMTSTSNWAAENARVAQLLSEASLPTGIGAARGRPLAPACQLSPRCSAKIH